MRLMIAALLISVLIGCQSVTDAISVNVDDNASLCIMTSADSINPLTNARVSAKRIEIPAGIDASKITSVEDLERLERVLCR